MTGGEATERFREQVIRGLRRTPRLIPPKFLYDDTGSLLFEAICSVPEYYPTRAEREILAERGEEIVRSVGTEIALVELGCGSAEKTVHLLTHLAPGSVYVPVDISSEALEGALRRVETERPDLEVVPLHADFTHSLVLPPEVVAARRVCVYLAGGNIGNFVPDDAAALLRGFSEAAGRDGSVLIGIDLAKDRDVLEAAYDDAAGVTAAFNRNLLVRMREELGARVDPDRFRHEAVYNAEQGRIEMYLVSEDDQEIVLGDERFAFARGDRICTEYSYKYTRERLEGLAGRAGLAVERLWTDRAGRFAEALLVAAG